MGKIIALFSVLFLTGCRVNNNSNDITYYSWKYNKGYNIGEIVEFKGNGIYELRNDTIFKSNLPVAKIVATTRNYIGGNDRIELKSLLTNETGTYSEK